MMTSPLLNDSTSEANPAKHSPITSHSRAASFAYALSGCRYMLRYQKNTRLMAIATAIVIPLALWLNTTPIEWAALLLAISMVWLCECLNAAIEAAVNLASPKRHPMAKTAKDVAAAAVLLAALSSALIGLLLLGPPLWHKLTAIP